MTPSSTTVLAPDQAPTLEVLRGERDRIIAIFKEHGASNIRIFGSVARGEAGPDSDIDFLCDYDIEKITAWFPSGPALELEKLLGRKVDIATGMNFRTERIKQKIERDLVKL